MKMKSFTHIFAVLSILFAPVMAQERVPVGSRAMTHLERVAFIEERTFPNELMNAPEEELEEPVQEEPVQEGEETREAVCLGYSYTTHAGAYHQPIAVSPLGDTVELEDGSIWSIKPQDRKKTLDWMTGDTIVITPNSSWFNWTYDFKLINKNTGVAVSANLSLGPIYNGIYTHWIVKLDYINNEVCLEDGSVWSISGFDSKVLKDWYVNDTVIIGINDAWFSSKANILINVNKLNYVSGNCNH